MRRHWCCILLIACLLKTISSRAATGQLYASDRLSSGLITCLCQDRQGFIWVGTEHGLNKFDGYRYTTYLCNQTDTTTLADNEIASLFVDRDGQLWVGCAKGLVRYDYEHDSFHRYHFPDDRRPRVNSMLQDNRGRLLIGTAGYGLYSYDARQGYIHYEKNFCKRHADDFYSRIHLDRQGNLWRSSHLETLTRFTIKDGQPTALHDYTSTCGQPMRFIDYNADELLIVCMSGILSYHYASGKLSDAGFDLSALPDGVIITNAMPDPDGNLYMATAGSGLMKIERGSRRLTRVESSNRSIDLNTAHVVDVMVDRSHHLWAGCYNKGLMMMSNQPSAFSTWSFSSQHIVTGGGVSSIATAEEGGTWCTVQNSGVYLLDADGHITAHPQSPVGTQLVYRDRQGRYWLTTKNVLYRYQPTTGQATAELTLPGRELNAMADDPQGRLYLSAYGMGLYVYDPSMRQGELLSMQQTDRKGGYLVNDWVKALTFDSRGLLWICTTSGVAMMKPEGCVFNSRGWNHLLEGMQCLSLCETRTGDMLIGTEQGLYLYDWKQNKTRKVPGAEQLDNKMLCAMVSDRDGRNIWVSTNSGIWQYDLQQGRLVSHMGGNGLEAWEYVQGALLHRQDDRIFFGTADGIVTFLPHDVDSKQQTLGLARLTRFTASGRVHSPLANRFSLPYTDNTITLEFSLLDYNNTENIAFQYRINGSGTWQQTSEGQNQLTFVQLAPGSYRIDVRPSAGGIVGDQLTTLYIRIRQPWYNTWWAWLLSLMAVVCFAGLTLFSWRSYQEEKRLHLTISSLKDNMRWLRGKFFGALEEQGDIKPVRVKGNDDALMERVVRCVNDNLSNPDFSVEQLTRDVGISRAQLHRKMKEMTGLSTSEFIRNLRLEQAARLILERKINITQVAYSVGFNNQAHFSTVFKKHYGMTPTEYAERGRIEN